MSKQSSVRNSNESSRNGTPAQVSRASSKSELNKSASNRSSKVGSPVHAGVAASKKIDHVDSFEKRMEEHSEIFAGSDSKYDYSYKTDSSTSSRTIPIQREDADQETKEEAVTETSESAVIETKSSEAKLESSESFSAGSIR